MAQLLGKTPVTLLIDDQGAGLHLESGELLRRLPEPGPDQPLRALWIPLLRELLPPGTEVQLLLAQPALLIQCQEAPFLSPREQRDVAARVFAAESGAGNLETAAALDPDPLAEGGHLLWLAAQPRAELAEWLAALQGAGLAPVLAIPFQRALLQGMDSLGEPSPDRIVLTVGPGAVGHLCCFHGRSLALQRSFTFPEDLGEAEELVYEEVSRLLQFIKQRNRELAFRTLEVLGLPGLSPAFCARVQGSLRLELRFLAPALWPVLLEGIRRERGRKAGLNLLPREFQEAGRRRAFKGVVWLASGILLLLFLGAGAFLFSQELVLQREVDRAELLLAQREARTAEEARVVEARIPLLRVRLAERHQGQAAAALAALGTALFEPPPGIQLEQVEITQAPGEALAHRFTVTGLAFTERSFSVGPLAQYLLALGRRPGLVLEPVAEASISDRVLSGHEAHPDQLAITRFTLKGMAK